MSCWKCRFKDIIIEMLIDLIEKETGMTMEPLPTIPEEPKIKYNNRVTELLKEKKE